MADESALERFSRKGRRVTFALLAILVIVGGGGLLIAFTFDPLRAIVYVVVTSVLASVLFPRLV